MKTLKSKFTFFNLAVVISLVLIISFVSTINFLNIRNQIDNLMINNYKSIKACNNMLLALEEENNGGSSLLKYNSTFSYQLNIEEHNITEPNENHYVDILKIDYNNFYNAENMSLIKNSSLFNNVKNDLNALITINETAMNNKKNIIISNTEISVFNILCFSVVSILIGFIISTYFTNKFLKPIFALIKAIKTIKDGNLDVRVPILSNDELGEMSKEFNKMLLRLKEFENSTAGELMDEKNKSIAIVKSISDPLVVLTPKCNMTLLNNSFEKIFKVAEKDALYKPFFDFLDNKELYNHIYDVLEQKKENSKIIEFHKNKEEYFFNVIVSLVKDIHQNITSVVVLFQNVTTLKQLERLKTNFVSTISHEFKTPLTSIMIGTSIISNQQIGSLNEKQKDIVNAIIEDSERLSELVTNLLQLSKIQTNEEAYNFSSCSINSIIENCAKAFYEQLSAKDIKLELEVGNKLPKVIADSEKISWVINNLISNALKYTTAGDYIIISAKVKLGEMHILVKDTGMGIPEQYKEKIFDKFVQVVGRDSEIRGSGLGLTISKEIVESHKGHIWCESEEDSGSTFTFTLPLE